MLGAMIQCALEDLIPAKVEQLRKWLDDPALQVLINVGESRLKALEAEMLDDFVNAASWNNFEESAKQDAEKAREWAAFLKILKEYAKGTKDDTSLYAWQTAKLS